MLKLSNGATVHAAFVLPGIPGTLKPHGIVLAETHTDWVVWSIHWDGDTTGDEQGQTNELWEAESGSYFQKGAAYLDSQAMAEFDFGIRLARLLTNKTKQGVHDVPR